MCICTDILDSPQYSKQSIQNVQLGVFNILEKASQFTSI